MRSLSMFAVAVVLVGLVVYFAWGDSARPPGPVSPIEDPGDARADENADGSPDDSGERIEASTVRRQVQSGEPDPAVPTTPSALLLVRVVYRVEQDAPDGAALEPAIDVPVYVESTSGDAAGVGTWRPRVTRRTDESGVARFEDLRPGPVRVTTALGGERSGVVELDRENGIRIVVPPGFALEGVAVDPAGAPVQSAAVWVSDAWEERRGETLATTDALGRFQLRGLRGYRYVSISADGFLPSALRPADGEPGEAVSLRFVLQRGTTGGVRGRVVGIDGDPIAGAMVLVGEDRRNVGRVRAADGSWVPGPPPRVARSGDDGRFEVRGVPPAAAVRVQARQVDLAPAAVTVDVLAGTSSVAPDLVLGPAAELFGTVERPDGTPAAGVVVTLEENAFVGGRMQTDDDGAYRFGGLAPGGEVELRAVTRTARAYVKVLLAEAVRYRVALRLRPLADSSDSAHLVRGRILDGRTGRALARWRVVITPAGSVGGSREQGVTDRDGRFELASAHAEVALQANPPLRWDELPRLFVPSVPADGVEREFLVPEPLTETGAIRGRVLDPFGQPHDASIEIWHEERRLYSTTRSNAATGEFRFDNVWPGPYRIDVHSAEYPWLNLAARDVARGQEVDLGDLELVGGGTIVGALRMAGGTAPPPSDGLNMVLIREARQVGVVEYSEGTFRSNALAPADDYLLVVRGPSVATKAVPSVGVRRGEETRLEIVLERAAERVLRFRLPPDRARPFPFTVLIVSVDSQQVVWNSSVMPGQPLEVRAAVAPGSYRVRAVTDGDRLLGEWPLEVRGFDDLAPIVYDVD